MSARNTPSEVLFKLFGFALGLALLCVILSRL